MYIRKKRGPYGGKADYSLHTKLLWHMPMTDLEKEQLRAIRLPLTQHAQSIRRATVTGRATALCHGAKTRAAKQGVEFDLTADWIAERIVLGCERTGIPFDLPGSPTTSRANKYAPSVDRRSGALGYVKSNCRVVVNIYNTAKLDYTDAELLAFAKILVDRQFAEAA